MASKGIVLVRIDDRMIHGIVATQWIPFLKANRGMVVNEKASKSDVIRMSLKMAIPVGVALSVLAPSKAAENFNANKYDGQRVVVVGKFISDIYAIWKDGVQIDELQLGNVTQNDVNDPTTIVIDKTVRVNQEELAMLKEMQAGGVVIYCQFAKNDAKKVCAAF